MTQPSKTEQWKRLKYLPAEEVLEGRCDPAFHKYALKNWHWSDFLDAWLAPDYRNTANE